MAPITRVLLSGLSVAAAVAVEKNLRGGSAVLHGKALLLEYNAALDGKRLEAGAPDNAITRVVSLLKDMQTNLIKEKEEDVTANTKLEGWCNTTKAEKTKAIAKSQEKLAALKAAADGGDAKKVKLTASIKELKKQIAASQKTVAEATSIREKQNAAYQSKDVELTKDLKSIKNALTVLDKKKPAPAKAPAAASLLQVAEVRGSSADVRSLDEFMQSNGYSYEIKAPVAPAVGKDGLTIEDQETLQQGLHTASMLLQAQGKSAKSLAGGQIIGMLKQMADRMQEDKAKADKAEADAAKTFAELQKAKQTELASAEKQAADQQAELAKSNVANVGEKNTQEQEQNLLTETEKALAATNTQCTEAQKSFVARVAARKEELEAVDDALEILARTSKAKPASFMQVSSSSSMEEERSTAAAVLHSTAMRTGSFELMALAVTSRINPIEGVIKSIDEMVATLKKEGEHESKKRDWCRKELATNAKSQDSVKQQATGLQIKYKGHGATLGKLQTTLTAKKGEIAHYYQAMEDAQKAYVKEQAEFKKTESDQLATATTLEQAITRLQDYYKKKAALVQTAELSADAPKQKDFKKNEGGAAAIVQLLKKLAKEARKVAAQTKATSKKAQETFQKFLDQEKAMVDTTQAERVTKKQELAVEKQASLRTQTDIQATQKTFTNLVGIQHSLKTDCDSLVANFDTLQAARKDEIEGLAQAKYILAATPIAKK